MNPHRKYVTIPLKDSFFTDVLTPIEIAESFQDQFCYLLESRDNQSAWGRYSFIGIHPFAYIKKHDDVFVLEDTNGSVLIKESSLKNIINQSKHFFNVKTIHTDLPFSGGAVGCIGYDAVCDFERVPRHPRNDLQIPVYEFIFCRTIIAFDHFEQMVNVIHYITLEESLSANERQAVIEKEKSRLTHIVSRIRNQSLHHSFIRFSQDINHFKHHHRSIKSTMRKQDYCAKAEKIKDYIGAGDVFQTVLSHRLEIDLPVSSWDLYRTLRVTNPSPYLFYFKGSGYELVGSSPERMVKVQDRAAEIHPIAGTRPRSKDRESDHRLQEELIRDEKERAEHLMLVDLARNDIGKVSEFGSVKVNKLMEVGKFAKVMHLVSVVEGTLKEEAAPVDALIAAFPAGTLSGAPKIRAMEIINELEPVSRGFYGGAVGYIGFDGNIDMCITIRTFTCIGGSAYIQAGAGIVADSSPEAEWEETFNKARALLQSAEKARVLFAADKEGQYV
ncbi:anthranilate synthase component 1 [Scopulibacillus daqui]|uniref:Anthranilate synthase component 1 n=1 Tax=Scopulibacillus daqui TaxID=1469162 RepID=A0ABS2Q0S8_9BACL|nr:anthranilate synthase component I [Scopulibacillus daqui]MBM7645289.1 anthranilate synthase component 1 [Scopulibacillus daqui]